MMEIVHTHIIENQNVVPINFEQKIKVNNPLQHRKPSPPKKLVVKDLICGKVVGCQKYI